MSVRLRKWTTKVGEQPPVRSRLLNLAVELGELSHAPRVKQLRVAHGDFQFLTFEETPRFLRAAAPEWKAFVTIALKTGLRVGELLALRREDLDLVAGRLVVRRTLWRDRRGRRRRTHAGGAALGRGAEGLERRGRGTWRAEKEELPAEAGGWMERERDLKICGR
jgi:integrase